VVQLPHLQDNRPICKMLASSLHDFGETRILKMAWADGRAALSAEFMRRSTQDQLGVVVCINQPAGSSRLAWVLPINQSIYQQHAKPMEPGRVLKHPLLDRRTSLDLSKCSRCYFIKPVESVCANTGCSVVVMRRVL